MAEPEPSEARTQIDVFLSYTDADQAWAEWMAAQLVETGASAFVRSQDIRPGQNKILALDQALQSHQRALLLLSPAALQDQRLQAEWASVIQRDPNGAARLLI